MAKAQQTATLGFRAKTGRAIAVALSGSRDQPRFLLRREVDLKDAEVPETAQPYHSVLELPWSRATVVVKDLVTVIERRASEVFAELRDELQSKGFALTAAGVVGSPDRSLEKIGNPHIRAHAAEGMTFRQVLEFAAAQHAIPCRSFSDRTIGISASAVDRVLKSLGQSAGAPWRLDEKAAATAAWILLAK